MRSQKYTQKERDRALKREEIRLKSALSNFRLQNVILKNWLQSKKKKTIGFSEKCFLDFFFDFFFFILSFKI
jgi:hypothetical protein